MKSKVTVDVGYYGLPLLSVQYFISVSYSYLFLTSFYTFVLVSQLNGNIGLVKLSEE